MTTEAGGFDAIVLAAGAGARFGGGKLLAPWAGGALLEGALAAAFAAPVTRVILVTGADAQVGGAAQDYAERLGEAARLVVVHAADHAEGMGASLRRAAAELEPACEGVFVFLGDMPRIPHAILPVLAEAVRKGAPAAAPVHQGQRGHPALLGRALLPQLRELSGDAGARGLLKRLGDRLALVEASDDGVLFDVDQPGDLGAPR